MYIEYYIEAYQDVTSFSPRWQSREEKKTSLLLFLLSFGWKTVAQKKVLN